MLRVGLATVPSLIGPSDPMFHVSHWFVFNKRTARDSSIDPIARSWSSVIIGPLLGWFSLPRFDPMESACARPPDFLHQTCKVTQAISFVAIHVPMQCSGLLGLDSGWFVVHRSPTVSPSALPVGPAAVLLLFTVLLVPAPTVCIHWCRI